MSLLFTDSCMGGGVRIVYSWFVSVCHKWQLKDTCNGISASPVLAFGGCYKLIADTTIKLIKLETSKR